MCKCSLRLSLKVKVYNTSQSISQATASIDYHRSLFGCTDVGFKLFAAVSKLLSITMVLPYTSASYFTYHLSISFLKHNGPFLIILTLSSSSEMVELFVCEVIYLNKFRGSRPYCVSISDMHYV